MTNSSTKKKWIKTFQFLAAYLVAAWTFLQFIDWILNRYSISPYWVDILLWTFIGLIPSLLIYLHHQDRINKRILKLREKIIFPLNIILLFVVIYFGFGNTDLGATTKDIEFTNEEGKLESQTITKEEFRIGVPIYEFKPLEKDSVNEWMRYGISRILYQDLLQNKNVSPESAYLRSTTSKIREASLFYDFYVDGTFKKNNNTFEITTYIRKANNGKILKEQTVKGENVLNLLDDISVFITSNVGFVEGNDLNYLDLPINEFMSNSLPAVKQFVRGNYNEAFGIDSSFALAYLERAKELTLFNGGQLETQDITDKAFALKNKLPLQKQLEVLVQKNLAYNNYAEAERLVKLQLEVDPNNSFYNSVLFSIYGETKDIKKYLEKTEDLFRKDPNADNGLGLTFAAMVNGEDDRIIDEIKKYEIIQPMLSNLKIQPLLFKGDIKTAESVINGVKLQDSSRLNVLKPYIEAASYLKKNKPKTSDLEQFVGSYRNDGSEQKSTFWIENDRIIRYISNQRMIPFLLSNTNAIVGGLISDGSYRIELQKDSLGNVYAYKHDQHFWNGTRTDYSWKLDPSILAAQNAFQSKKFIVAQQLYKAAITKNPEHFYLKNHLKHINYIQSKDSLSLKEQHKAFAGTYGKRLFWYQDGKFYYKRQSENTSIPKVELLAIDETHYIDLTRLNTVMEFVQDPSGKMASYASQYNFDEKKWVPSERKANYFLKD